MSLTVDSLRQGIEGWRVAVYDTCGLGYLEAVARPWFEEIAPERAAAYGVLGLNELGVDGVVYQVYNCYFRWRHLEDEGTGWSGMADTVRDALGYAVLAGVVGGARPGMLKLWERVWESRDAGAWYRDLRVDHYGGHSAVAFRLASAMYNDTIVRLAEGVLI